MPRTPKTAFSAVAKHKDTIATSSFNANADNRISLWQMRNAKACLIAFKPVAFPCTYLAFLEENRLLAASVYLQMYQLYPSSEHARLDLIGCYMVRAFQKQVAPSPVSSFLVLGNSVVAGYADGTVAVFDIESYQMLAHVAVGTNSVCSVVEYAGYLLVACGCEIYSMSLPDFQHFRLLQSFDRQCLKLEICSNRFLAVYQANTEYIAAIELKDQLMHCSQVFIVKAEINSGIVDMCVSDQLVFCLYENGTIIGFNAADFRPEIEYYNSESQHILHENGLLWLFPQFRGLII